MLFVPVISPDTNRYDAGVSWWEDMERNGEFFRSFASSFIAANGVDSSNVWTMGYSGGAEFITYELNTKPQTWRNGGGSIMVAGGGLDEGTPSAALKSQPMFGTQTRTMAPARPTRRPGAHEAPLRAATTHTATPATPTLPRPF